MTTSVCIQPVNESQEQIVCEIIFNQAARFLTLFLVIHMEMPNANQTAGRKAVKKGSQSVRMDAVRTPRGEKRKEKKTWDLHTSSPDGLPVILNSSVTAAWYHCAHTEAHRSLISPAQRLPLHCNEPLIISYIGVWQ